MDCNSCLVLFRGLQLSAREFIPWRGKRAGARSQHTFWTHPLIPDEPVTIAGNDGDDAPRYLEKQVNRVLEKLEEMEEEE